MMRQTIGTWAQWTFLGLAVACGGIRGLGNDETGGAGSGSSPSTGASGSEGSGGSIWIDRTAGTAAGDLTWIDVASDSTVNLSGGLQRGSWQGDGHWNPSHQRSSTHCDRNVSN